MICLTVQLSEQEESAYEYFKSFQYESLQLLALKRLEGVAITPLQAVIFFNHPLLFEKSKKYKRVTYKALAQFFLQNANSVKEKLQIKDFIKC